MKITVGFITSGKNPKLLECIESVYRRIPNVEVIVVGGENQYPDSVKHIEFDDTVKQGWITRKKNIITYNASGCVIVYCHDYFMFMDGWMDEWIRFGWDWDYACNRIELINGARDYDLISWDHPKVGRYCLMPYDMITQNDLKGTYVSGGYVMAKKTFMMIHPFNEVLSWGMSEDIDWSLRARAVGRYSFNQNSIVRHNKEHLRYMNMLKFGQTQLPVG